MIFASSYSAPAAAWPIYATYCVGSSQPTGTVPGIELVHSAGAICRARPQSAASTTTPRIFVQADGELLGTLPAEISVIPDAVTLLVPTS